MKVNSILSTIIAILLLTSLVSAGENVPDFTLGSFDGSKVALSDYKGKALFINFWGTWCPPCREEIPAFNELYKKYNKEGFEVFGIAMERRNPEESIERFLQTHEVAYPILIGNRSIYMEYQNLVQPDSRGAVPTTFVVDRKGELIKVFVGSRSKAIFEEAVVEALEE